MHLWQLDQLVTENILVICLLLCLLYTVSNTNCIYENTFKHEDSVSQSAYIDARLPSLLKFCSCTMDLIGLLFQQQNKSDKWKAFSLISKQIWLIEALWSSALKKERSAQHDFQWLCNLKSWNHVSVIDKLHGVIQNSASFSFGFSKDVTLLY